MSKPFARLIQFGTGQYTVPNQLLDIFMAFVTERIIAPETADELDALLANWRKMQPAMPRYWHEDRLPAKNVEIVPSPNFEGQYFATTAGDAFYGTISDASTFSGYSGFYGTFSGFNGPVWLSAAMPFYGTIESITPSTGNLVLIRADQASWGRYQPRWVYPARTADMEGLHTLRRARQVFRDNSETKDEARAQYQATLEGRAGASADYRGRSPRPSVAEFVGRKLSNHASTRHFNKQASTKKTSLTTTPNPATVNVVVLGAGSVPVTPLDIVLLGSFQQAVDDAAAAAIGVALGSVYYNLTNNSLSARLT